MGRWSGYGGGTRDACAGPFPFVMRPSARTVALAAAALALLAIAVRLAWIGDDAYITLRTVENLASGHGPRWNLVDRVQTYTHPLWMLLLTGGRLVGGEVYFTTIVLSLLCSTAAIVLLLGRATTVTAVAALAVVLGTARAFGDYTTSGLETPLTYLLLAGFVRVVDRDGDAVRRFARAALLAALLATNRMDLALLCAPAVIGTLRGVGGRAAWTRGALAAAPFVGWLLFATVYYGSPFPVTAHAKIFGVGIPAADLWRQGLFYLRFTLVTDPVLVLTVVVGVVVAWCDRRTRWLALGALLYAGYVVKVGGDFMAGRFLLPPFVVAVAVLGPRLAARRLLPVAVLLAAVVLQAVRGLPPWLCAPAAEPPQSMEAIMADGGICDERRFYQPQLGLFGPAREIPEFESLWRLVWPEPRRERWFLLNGSAGVASFRLGRSGHLVDPLLCEPLVTRLPARDPGQWRIGHVLRRFPEGYWETLRDGVNRIRHPGLHAYAEALRTATQAPLFARQRLAAIGRLWSGALDDGFRAFVREHYYNPPRAVVASAALPPPLPLGTFWFDDARLQIVYEGGVAVALSEPLRAATVRLQVLGACEFRVRFRRGGETVGEAMAARVPSPPQVTGLRHVAGLREEVVAVPPDAGAFDELWLDVVLVPGSEFATGPPALGALWPGG